MRKFEAVPAQRKSVPVLVALFSPSGGGKSFSSLRLAAGMERASGKPTYCLDTEANRALHYADQFRFQHVPFVAPFGPLDYLQAIEYCARQGAGQVIVDSLSHVWEGPSGVLEMHEAEVERMAGNDYAKRERVKMTAWIKPKAEIRRLINSILQINCNFIFCLRAKEKMKIVRGQEPIPLGFQPIVGDEFVYEMTMNLFLPPRADGVPDLKPAEVGERAMLKVPVQFRDMLVPGKPLDEELGEKLARWAAGGAAPAPREDTATLLTTIEAHLKSMPATTDAEKESRSAALQVAFGTRSWKSIQKMDAAALRQGMTVLGIQEGS